MSKRSNHLFKFALACVALVVIAPALPAAVLDLGSNGSGTINGAFFDVSAQHSAGTGVFDPFLTVQNSPWEQGYNSGAGVFDTKRDPQWNHEIQFSDLQQTMIDGTAYFGFVVDVNEPNGGGKSPISLNGLMIFTSSTLQHDTSVDANGFFNGSLGTLRYTLGDNTVLYDDKHSGSGTADISIFIPVSAFAGTNANDYVYMYQRWGNTQFSEGGYEETSILQGTVPVPEMGTLFPVIGLLVAVLSTQILRRRKMKEMAALQLSSQ